jgi:hypothetical protein
LNIGSPDSLGYFWADLSRSYYSYRESGLWGAGDHFLSLAANIFHVQGSLLLNHLISEFSLWSMLLAVLGLVVWTRTKEKRGLIFITIASITLMAAIFSFQPAPDALERPLASSKFLLFLYEVISLCGSVGLAYALYRMEGTRKGSSRFLAAGAVLLLLAGMADGWTGMDQGRQLLAYDYGVDQLKSLPRGSLFFAEADEDYFSLYYLQQVEHRRPDVTVLPAFLLFEPWGTAQVEARYPGLGLTASSMAFPDHFARIIYATSEIVVKGRDRRPIGFSRFDGAFHRFYLARYPSVKARSSGIVALLDRPLVRVPPGPSLGQLRRRDPGNSDPSLSGIRQVYALLASGQ